ncbi:hypothetical protein CPB86DRAFT_762455 [Serendipita vermifera]|nr:hypothetical protein CPB86DRAFT_762455 [Serendipita vermifera]
MATKSGRQPRPEKLNNPFSNINISEMLERDQSSIDINIPYIENRIAAFRQNLAKYTTMNQEELMKRRDLYVQEIESLRVEKAQVTQDIQNARLKEISLAKLLEEERLERKQAEELVAHNNRQLKSMEERLTEKDRESKRLDASLENLKKSKEKEKRILDKQATQLARDVIDLERMLGLSMRGAGNDLLKVSFTNMESGDPERVFYIVIDLSGHEYQVTDASPLLPALPTLLEGLNTHRDLFVFLRQIRQAFIASLDT